MFHKALMIAAALGMLSAGAQASPTSQGYAHQSAAIKIAGSASVPAPAAPAGQEGDDVFGLGASRPFAPALAQVGGFDDFDAPAPASADRPSRP
jgi:hypothetical protein